MNAIEVRTQAELDAALAALDDDDWIECVGKGTFDVTGSASVRATGSASVRAYGSASVRAHDSACVVARTHCTVIVRESDAASVQIDGGHVVTLPTIRTAEEWCDYYGADVRDGVATLYKAVRGDYRSAYGLAYLPGTIPVAPDWDGGRNECGGGLHFCASPAEAAGFDGDVTRYVACPVRVADIVVHADADYPQKIKAPGCCGPVWECDFDGERLADCIERGEGE